MVQIWLDLRNYHPKILKDLQNLWIPSFGAKSLNCISLSDDRVEIPRSFDIALSIKLKCFPFRGQYAILTSIVTMLSSAMNTTNIARRRNTSVKNVAEPETACRGQFACGEHATKKRSLDSIWAVARDIMIVKACVVPRKKGKAFVNRTWKKAKTAQCQLVASRTVLTMIAPADMASFVNQLDGKFEFSITLMIKSNLVLQFYSPPRDFFVFLDPFP